MTCRWWWLTTREVVLLALWNELIGLMIGTVALRLVVVVIACWTSLRDFSGCMLLRMVTSLGLCPRVVNLPPIERNCLCFFLVIARGVILKCVDRPR